MKLLAHLPYGELSCITNSGTNAEKVYVGLDFCNKMNSAWGEFISIEVACFFLEEHPI